MAKDGLKSGLTPEQRDCIRQATEALEKLNKLTSEDRLSPEEVFMIVTCNGQREMTLERFKDALRHLTI